MEKINIEMAAHNWLSTTALVNEGLIDYPELKKTEFLPDQKGRRINEFLLGGTNSADVHGVDKIFYNLRTRSDNNEIKISELNIDPNSEKIGVELEWKGEKKMFWYFKNQLDFFKEAFSKLQTVK